VHYYFNDSCVTAIFAQYILDEISYINTFSCIAIIKITDLEKQTKCLKMQKPQTIQLQKYVISDALQ
jgi:hypothetical protein